MFVADLEVELVQVAGGQSWISAPEVGMVVLPVPEAVVNVQVLELARVAKLGWVADDQGAISVPAVDKDAFLIPGLETLLLEADLDTGQVLELELALAGVVPEIVSHPMLGEVAAQHRALSAL